MFGRALEGTGRNWGAQLFNFQRLDEASLKRQMLHTVALKISVNSKALRGYHGRATAIEPLFIKVNSRRCFSVHFALTPLKSYNTWVIRLGCPFPLISSPGLFPFSSSPSTLSLSTLCDMCEPEREKTNHDDEIKFWNTTEPAFPLIILMKNVMHCRTTALDKS